MDTNEFSDFLNNNGFNSSFLNDERFKDEPGTILCNKLRKEIDNNPKHNISLNSALEFINFYGIRGVMDMHDPYMHIISQEALRAIDLAILAGHTIKMAKD